MTEHLGESESSSIEECDPGGELLDCVTIYRIGSACVLFLVHVMNYL